MTLEQLIRIVVEAVERAITLNRFKIAAYAFNKANTEQTLQAARVINGSAVLLSNESLLSETDSCDILFLDSIPIEYLPKLALGICDDSVSRLINMMPAQGKTIFVLRAPEQLPNAPMAFKALMNTYRGLLNNYGYIFLDSENNSSHNQGLAGSCRRFTGNVLSRADLMSYPRAGEIIVGPDCVVTALALETAKQKDVTIKRQSR